MQTDLAEASREARRIVDANRAQAVLIQEADDTGARKRVKFTRSTAGCLSCRQRKVRCDETVPACLRCVGAQRECTYPPPKEPRVRRRRKAKVEVVKSETDSSPDLDFIHELAPPQVEALPRFVDIGKSALLSRRNDKARIGSIEGRLPRLVMVDSILEAYETDDQLFEFGPSQRHRAMVVHTDVLTTVFPSPTARTLFNFYCNSTSKILITMGNVGPNPMLSLCTPFRLLDPKSAASAAMRMSMLSMSVTHYAHEAGVGEDQKRKLEKMSQKFKKAAMSNILLSARTDGGTDQVDKLLAACVLVCMRDVSCSDTSWRANIEFALNLISKKGGPQAMLQPGAYSFARRYLVEYFAVHDVFSSFITGKEPSLLGNYDAWWFDSVETSTTRWEWESVERTYGISRAMVDLVARMAVLDSHKRRLGISLKGHPDELWDAGQQITREAHCLLLELDIWGNSLNALPQHVRVTCGDYIYKYMSVVYVLSEILEQPPESPQVVKAVDNVLELCSEASAMRMSVMLIWPLMIAGVFCLKERRGKVRELFEAFRDEYLEDLQSARRLLEEQWRCIDRDGKKLAWCEVMKRMDLEVLLI